MDKKSENFKMTPEEIQLWEDYWNDIKNNDNYMTLVEFYLPLVAKVANHMPRQVKMKITQNELLSIGVVGLHSALTSFDKDKGVPFESFAYRRIYGSMMDDLRSQDHLTRTQRARYKQLNEISLELTKKLSRIPTNKEIAQVAELDELEVTRHLNMGRGDINIADEFQDGLKYSDVLTDATVASPLEITDKSMAMDDKHGLFRNLKENEQKVLYLRHYEDLSTIEVGEVMGITKSRVSQIYKIAVEKLQVLFNV